MLRCIYAVTASLGLVACGLAHGIWTDRWTPAVAPQEAAARLDDIPLAVGDWHGEAVAVKPGQAGAGVAGHVQRRYKHRKTGAEVVLALVCGRPGPVSIHTPDACYPASGFTIGPRTRVSVGGVEPAATFWTADASRAQLGDETRVRVFWGWSSGQGWAAADDARRAFARYPVLYKLYASRELSGPGEPAKDEPCKDFLQALLPELQQALFPPRDTEPRP
jgi:hypothetical protein